MQAQRKDGRHDVEHVHNWPLGDSQTRLSWAASVANQLCVGKMTVPDSLSDAKNPEGLDQPVTAVSRLSLDNVFDREVFNSGSPRGK